VVLATSLLVARAPAQGGWTVAKCDIKPGHFLVNSGLLYLKSAANGRFQEQIQKDLRDANRSLIQAITSNGQDKNPAAWYYLGRYYVAMKDAVGADSAFTRTEQLLPACKEDIAWWRRNLWVPLYNAGIQAFNAGQTDSSIKLFQQANAIYRGEPTGFKILGVLFVNANQPDSAARYFRLAIQVADVDPKYAADKKESLYNLAANYYRAQRWEEAKAAYREYLTVVPNDPQALAGLASIYSNTGKPDSATLLYGQIIDKADSVDAMSLFFAGTSIFSAAPRMPDTATTGSSCRAEARRNSRTLTARAIAARCDSVTARATRSSDSAAVGYYRLAAKAFEAGLTKNPSFRDAQFNLANAYLALKDTARMLPVAKRLHAVDPMNRMSLRLLAQAYQFQKRGDSTLFYLTVADSLLPVEVTVGSFQPQEQNASLSGLITNFHTKPSAPLKLVFEFLNAKGDVVATQTVSVPQVEAGGNYPFQLQAIGAGIVAWRYHMG
jgi:tetratricopeptide (TPR) repeat protein